MIRTLQMSAWTSRYLLCALLHPVQNATLMPDNPVLHRVMTPFNGHVCGQLYA